MSGGMGLRFLRPYIYRNLPLTAPRKEAYLRFYSASIGLERRASRRERSFHSATDRKEKQTAKQKENRPTSSQPSWDKTLEDIETQINDQWPKFLKLCEDSGIPEDQIPKIPADVFNVLGQLREGVSSDVKARIQELMAKESFKYPRIQRDERAVTIEEFRTKYAHLQPTETIEEEVVTIRGRIYSIRISGSKLAFLDIVQNGHRLQGHFKYKRLADNGVSEEEVAEFPKLVRRGDVICKLSALFSTMIYANFSYIAMTGVPYRTPRGELSLSANETPILLSASLASLPTTLTDRTTRVRNRHADLLVNQESADTLRLRSDITRYLRDFLIADKFVEVQTPIVTDGAGGAIARPFVTKASEFMDKDLNLRIAPELWLKRLILGGMDRVFEIGPAFRNEGLDATHNPEYTTCEFYKSYADLEDIISMTEKLISGLAIHSQHLISTRYTSLPTIDTAKFSGPYKRLEFIPTLESVMSIKLPDLQADDATQKIVAIFKDRNIELTAPYTLPKLLDKLASLYIEPSCIAPTFITHHPACMAPLSKSFVCPKTKQMISARAELFIAQREYVNLYEEENSPVEQRAKLLEQLKWKIEMNGDAARERDAFKGESVEESYLEALEWGLPPTGGWGCGVDRLVMLFSGRARISDVLSFGSLKHVVGLGGRVVE